MAEADSAAECRCPLGGREQRAAPERARRWPRGQHWPGGRNDGCGGSPSEERVQKAADELVGAERHDALAVRAIAAVIFVAERDTMLVERDQPTVWDGDAVGVSRQIGEHRLGPGERRLGVHDPALLPQRRQVTKEGMSLAQADVATEELEAA